MLVSYFDTIWIRILLCHHYKLQQTKNGGEISILNIKGTLLLQVNSNGARSGHIEVIATSPTGRRLDCPVNERNGVYTATFQPDEAGEWSIAVRHSGELIQGGPFTCHVYDPNGIKVPSNIQVHLTRVS